jgi:hypothetical protein
MPSFWVFYFDHLRHYHIFSVDTGTVFNFCNYGTQTVTAVLFWIILLSNISGLEDKFVPLLSSRRKPQKLSLGELPCVLT